MLAAVAVVIMCLGTLIPVATYVCPMLCIMTQMVVLHFVGKRLSWAWYVAVVILSLLLAPDKEAAIVFLALGYYPILKGRIECCKFSFVVKGVYFNVSVILAYHVMLYLLGMEQIAAENAELGFVGMLVLLLMGNVTFYLMDKLLDIMKRKLR